ncbi:hypothetical protein ACFO25_11090 [Paenactinomyces guangxiensis]|uniref:Uncharacterized protein n=1 Tax=Paenactinomyces guangxiensis TaxID=1490290 RepID=A0A7W2A8D9_9BACL|nr:hypothetical protein [Paenactinomyces guangxiensis]MBA4494059.1 hypothetical protein [Paenactinomyces guangxiensis]MBH8591196.1 hypothetical protein [Paenactinomyces guangxiensis]
MVKSLFSTLVHPSIQTLAVVGLSKNAGKTTVLNAMIRELYPRISLGLASIGIDGEERDAWSGRNKPPVYVPEGVCVATAGPLLDLQPGHWEVLLATGVHTLMGEVFIARCRRANQVKLAGVNSSEGVARIKRGFQMAGGVQLTLLDGAYDRQTTASPYVTDAALVVAGASLSSSLQGVLQKMEEWFHLFTRPVCREDQLSRLGRRAIEERSIFAIVNEKVEKLPFATLLQMARNEAAIAKNWQAVAVPGALTDRMLHELMEKKAALTIVVPDATHLFLSLPAVRRFYQMGGDLQVCRNIHLLGVAVNPVSPEGFSFPPAEMKQKVAKICAPLPVIDVVREPVQEGGGGYACG